MADVGLLHLADGSVIERGAMLRSLPGKRAVFAGRRNGEQVLVKAFLDPRRGALHARREASGLQAFHRAGIAAPRVLYDGSDRDGHAVVVLQWIAHAQALGDVFDQADAERRGLLMTRMMQLLAEHHMAGICQSDLHPDNFLLAGDTLYSIDGAAVASEDGALDEKRSLANVALFCAQFTPDIDAGSLTAAAAYRSRRGWPDESLRALPALIDSARLHRWQKLLPKLYRDCSAVQHRVRCGRDAFVMRAAGEALAALADDPDASCPSEPARWLKNGNTATVWQTRAGEVSVVIKRYNIKNRLHGAGMLLKQSRASISWRNAHMLGLFGIPTAEPLALVMQRRRLFGRRAWYISRALDGVSLDTWLDAHVDDPVALAAMTTQVGTLFAALSKAGISHGDTKATNFIVVDDRLHLIDLDAMQRHHSAKRFARARRRDVRRFLANWRTQPGLQTAMQAAIGDSPNIAPLE